jgi:hypothetical protein
MPARSAPPPGPASSRPLPGYSRPSSSPPPAGSAAPPARPGSGPRSLSTIPRKPIADDFESEEPTGQVSYDEPAQFEETEEVESSRLFVVAARAPEPELAAPAQTPLPKARQRGKTLAGTAAPTPTTPAQQPPEAGTPRVEALKQAQPLGMRRMEAAGEAHKTPRPLWPAIVALLVLIALLIWWLAR